MEAMPSVSYCINSKCDNIECKRNFANIPIGATVNAMSLYGTEYCILYNEEASNVRYKKKPVVIDAYQYNSPNGIRPSWIKEAFEEEILTYNDGQLYVNTLEENMMVSLGDWIIKGVDGELYPCKPSIFDKTYEEVK